MFTFNYSFIFSTVNGVTVVFCCCSVIDDISLTNPLCVRCSTRYQHIEVYVIRINAYVYFPFVRNVFLNMFPIFLFFSFLMRFSDFLISMLKNYSLNLFFLASIFSIDWRWSQKSITEFSPTLSELIRSLNIPSAVFMIILMISRKKVVLLNSDLKKTRRTKRASCMAKFIWWWVEKRNCLFLSEPRCSTQM